MSDSTSIDPEVLLRETRWLQTLAVNLVHDEQLAEDLVQSTFLQALTHPPRSAGALRAWLGKVTRRLAFRASDRTQWLRRWERSAARPEAEPSSADLVARASVHRMLVEAVLALDEPNRSTVLLRYFEDLPPREIAKRHGVPVATVRSRVRRALDQLRERLDGRAGGREAWLSALAIPAAPLAAAGVSAGVSAGGALMITKTKIVAAAIVLLFAGAIGWRATQSSRDDGKQAPGPRTGNEVVAIPGAAPQRPSKPATHPIVARRYEDVEENAAGSRLIGVVVDDETGDVLGNAEVIFYRNEEGFQRIQRTTNADGSFSVPLREEYWDPSRDRLKITAADHVPWEFETTRPQPESRITGRDTDLRTIRLDRGAIVTGRVVTATGRKPVAGASLFLWKYHWPWWYSGATPVGTSGEDGAFTLPERLGSTRGRATFLIAVHATGVDWTLTNVVKGSHEVEVEILAHAGCAAKVEVVDANRRPQPETLVFAMPGFWPFGGTRTTTGWPAPPEMPPADSPVRKLVDRFLKATDASGSVSFEGLPEARLDPVFDPGARNAFDFFAFKEGFDPGRETFLGSASVIPVTLVVTPIVQRAILGVVHDRGGSPVAGARLLMSGVITTTTSDSGEYRIALDQRFRMGDKVFLGAGAAGYAAAERSVVLAPGQPNLHVDFILQPAVAVTGRIVDEVARPVARVPVTLMRSEGGSRAAAPGENGGKTRDDGTFSFPAADVGEWDLLVSPGSEWEAPRAQRVFGGETIEVVLCRVHVGKARIVADVVDDATGAALDPLGGALWPTHAVEGDRNPYTPLDVARGRVSAEKVAPGAWRLIVTAVGYARSEQIVTVGPSDEEVRLKVALGRPGMVIAKVVLDEIPPDRRPNQITIWAPDCLWVTEPGKPSPHATLGCGTASSSNEWTCRFEGVRPNVPLRFWLESSAAFSDEQLLKIGSSETKTIELRPRLDGKVELSTGGKVAGGLVLQVGDDNGEWHSVASKTLERPNVWAHEIRRASGPFRWRVELWPLDVAPRLRLPRVVEGEAMIQAEKTTTIKVTIPD